MDDRNMPSLQNISELERQFREKFYELQSNADTLQTMQKELLETRYALYSTELELEKERGVSQELRMRLRAVTEVVNESQQQQTKSQVENVQLRVKYEAMEKQCESLMSQAVAAKAHEAECKIKIRTLEENLRQKDASNKRIEQALKKLETKSRNLKRNINICSNPAKRLLSSTNACRLWVCARVQYIKRIKRKSKIWNIN